MNLKNMFGNKKAWLFGGVALLGTAAIASAGFLGGLKLRQDSFRSQAPGQFSQMRENPNREQGNLKNQGRSFDQRGERGERMMENSALNSGNRQQGNQGNSIPGIQNGTGLGRTLEGKIVSKDDTSITIETTDGTKTITLTDGVAIEKITSASVTDLSSDEQVVISLDGPINGDSLSAQKIQIKN